MRFAHLAPFALAAALFIPAMASASASCGPTYQIFDTPGQHTFTVPNGVTSIRVVAIGAGGGGGAGAGGWGSGGGGGCSGGVAGGTMAVTPGQQVPLYVGYGGAGGNGVDQCPVAGFPWCGTFNVKENGGTGGDSGMGSVVGQGGGWGRSGFYNLYNQNSGGTGGGSGGGGGGNGWPGFYATPGAGGSAGGQTNSAGAGGWCSSGTVSASGAGAIGGGQSDSSSGGVPTGTGQWSPDLSSLITKVSSTPGAGGYAPGGSVYWGGGGGGGLIINGSAVNGGDGQSSPNNGGKGYGGGGGGSNLDNKGMGGSGASGAVYIEWDGGSGGNSCNPTPACSVTFDQNPIQQGGGTTMHWTSSGGSLFYINNVGYVPASGSTQVAPAQTTDYSGFVGDVSSSGNSQAYTMSGTYTAPASGAVTITTIGGGGGGGGASWENRAHKGGDGGNGAATSITGSFGTVTAQGGAGGAGMPEYNFPNYGGTSLTTTSAPSGAGGETVSRTATLVAGETLTVSIGGGGGGGGASGVPPSGNMAAGDGVAPSGGDGTAGGTSVGGTAGIGGNYCAWIGNAHSGPAISGGGGGASSGGGGGGGAAADNGNYGCSNGENGAAGSLSRGGGGGRVGGYMVWTPTMSAGGIAPGHGGAGGHYAGTGGAGGASGEVIISWNSTGTTTPPTATCSATLTVNTNTQCTSGSCSCSLGGPVCQGDGTLRDSCGNVTQCPLGCSATTNACNTCPSGTVYDPVSSSCASSCRSGYHAVHGICVLDATCTDYYYCSGNNLVHQYLDNTTSQCTTSSASCGNLQCTNGACTRPQNPQILSWRVRPTLVRTGTQVSVSWSSAHVSSCTVTGSNQDGTGLNPTGLWNTLADTKTSSAITAQTVFTLNCLGLPGALLSSISTSTTVNLVPSFQQY